jgi:iron complex outermembrane receptor protein
VEASAFYTKSCREWLRSWGISRSNLATFSSEFTSNGIQAPESGLQYEAGLKLAEFNDRVILTVAAFDIKRNNVFTLLRDVPFSTTRQLEA